MAKMITTLYRFEDGYFCYTAGRLSAVDKRNEIKKHGKIISEKIVK